MPVRTELLEDLSNGSKNMKGYDSAKMSFSMWKLKANKAKSDNINADLFSIISEFILIFNFIALPDQRHSRYQVFFCKRKVVINRYYCRRSAMSYKVE